jgi:hypothetical protein
VGASIETPPPQLAASHNAAKSPASSQLRFRFRRAAAKPASKNRAQSNQPGGTRDRASAAADPAMSGCATDPNAAVCALALIVNVAVTAPFTIGAEGLTLQLRLLEEGAHVNFTTPLKL